MSKPLHRLVSIPPAPAGKEYVFSLFPGNLQVGHVPAFEGLPIFPVLSEIVPYAIEITKEEPRLRIAVLEIDFGAYVFKRLTGELGFAINGTGDKAAGVHVAIKPAKLVGWVDLDWAINYVQNP